MAMRIRQALLAGAVVGGFAICLIYGLGLKEVKAGSLLVDTSRALDSQVVTIYRENQHIFDGDGRLCEPYRIVETDSMQTTAGIIVHPITDNPKVRDLRCQVEIALPPLDDRSDWNSMLVELNGDEPATYAKRLMYEFAEKRSRELSQFYNPLDDGQQQKFRFMVEDDLTHPLLQAGLGFKTARFDLN